VLLFLGEIVNFARLDLFLAAADLKHASRPQLNTAQFITENQACVYTELKRLVDKNLAMRSVAKNH